MGSYTVVVTKYLPRDRRWGQGNATEGSWYATNLLQCSGSMMECPKLLPFPQTPRGMKQSCVPKFKPVTRIPDRTGQLYAIESVGQKSTEVGWVQGLVNSTSRGEQ